MSFPSQVISRRCIFSLFIGAYALLSLHLMLSFMIGSKFGMNDTPDGTLARPPIAYRVLVPVVTEAIYQLIPEDAKQTIAAPLVLIGNSPFVQRLEQGHIPQNVPTLLEKNIVKTLVSMCLDYLILLAFIYILYVFTKAILPESDLYALMTPLVALLLLPAFAIRYGYTYDFAELFFSCACLYLLFKERWRPYLACFLLAVLNKETAVFTIIFFMVWFCQRLPARQYLLLSAAQWLIYAVVKTGLLVYFFDRPARYYVSSYKLRLPDQLVYLLDYDYRSVLCLLVTFSLLTFRWHEKPAFLRAGLVMFVSTLPPYFLTCNPGEYRDFYCALPPMILLATHTLVRLSGMEHLPLFQPVAQTKKA